MNRSRFSLTDLIAAIFFLSIFLLFSLAATANLDSDNTRVKCASNLRQIGQAMLLYTNDAKGPYPRTKYNPSFADNPTTYTGVDSTDPFAAECPQVNDVSSALYLLLRTEDITSQVFICPATGKQGFTYGGGIHTALDKANFPSSDSLCYSYANPYPTAAARGQGYDLHQGLSPLFAVAADMNPGDPSLTHLTTASTADEMRKGNSLNHSGDGQNVLYGDGHVEFQNNPLCGIDRDNIYTWGAGGGDGVYGSPIGPSDSVLLPAVIMPPVGAPGGVSASAVQPSTANPPPAAAPIPPMDQGTDVTDFIVIPSVVLLVGLLMALAVMWSRIRRRKTPADH